MAQIKSLTAIRDKWTQVTPSRAPQFQAGVQSPMADWATNAKAAASAFEQGVTQAIANKSFEKGVSAAGTSTWQEGALQKGVTRYGPGVAASGPKFESGFAPYHEVISRLTLPARGMRGDPRNYQRVQAVGDALHAKKVSG
jgi:hypothetical protein